MDDRCTVLIVDDETGPRQSLRMLLKPLYRMPGMGGAAVLKAIKETNPNIPVLIITGHGTLRQFK